MAEVMDCESESEEMDYQTTEPEPSYSSGNQAPLPDPSVVTQQPYRIDNHLPDQTPPGQNQNQEDLRTAGLGGSDPGVLSAAQMISPFTVTVGQPQDRPDMRASQEPDLYRSAEEIKTSAADTQSSSVSKSSDTTHKKRDITLTADPRDPTGHPGNQMKDTTDKDETNPSAPQDVARVCMKVDWTGELPPRWNNQLAIALQSWCNSKAKEKCSVVHFQILKDERTAVVGISPSTAIKDIKTAELTFKEPSKPQVRVHFHDFDPNLVNEVSSPEDVYRSAEDIKTSAADTQVMHPGNQMKVKESVTAMTDTETNRSDGGASAKEMTEAPDALTVPPFLYLYLSQAYGKDVEQIENEFGVKINAEVRVSISAEKSNEKRGRDSVRRASQAFSTLYQAKLNNVKPIYIPPTHMESEIMKHVLNHIPDKENKIMLSMSENNYLLLGPEAITSMVEKRLNLEPGVESGATSLSQSKSHNMETSGNWPMQTAKTLDMDIKDTQTPVEMDEAHWILMKTVFDKQLGEIQSKYGVQFDAEPVQGLIKVSARFRGTHQINLEAHALRALTCLYQKVVTSAVTCDLKDVSYTELVLQVFERIRLKHPCVGGGKRNGSWKLFGLPTHLLPAIADIEKLTGKPVFDDKAKQLLGYPWEFPQTSGFQREQMGMGVMRGAHGTDLSGGTEADNWGFNSKLSLNAKENGKEEETCPICLDTFTEKTKTKCGHEFCRMCLEHSLESNGEICPVCKQIFGMLKGNQPDGKMNVHYSKHRSLPGFPGCGMIEITYIIPDGIQTSEHPHPGKPYYGTHRTAYLPDNAEGNHVLALLKRAFDQKHIFTVGFSRTTGTDDVVTWNDIHHKTSTSGGPGRFGYPDPDYLRRVKEELKAKGIE